MAFRPAGQGNPHGLSRVRAVGSPFEVSNNSSQVPQTLNYVDCYPMKEEQFGEDPLYAVTCREAFKSIAGASFDFSSVTITGTGATAVPPCNTATPPASLAGYLVSQIGQLLVVDDSTTNVGGTTLFCNVMLQYNGTAPTSTNQFVVVSVKISVSGNSGTTVITTPTYLFFDTGPTIGAAAIANNSITGVQAAFIDPYYLVYSSPQPLALTISSNTANYNIYNAAAATSTWIAAPGAYAITVTINAGVTVGTLLTGSGFYAGTTITIINNGTILGNGGAGGTGGNNGGYAAGAGSPGTAAIILNWPVLSLTNTGIIAGGGGGGGGSFGVFNSGSHLYTSGGSGGGGGAGYTGGAGGTAGAIGGSFAGNPGGAGNNYNVGTTSGFGGAGYSGNPAQVAGVSGYLVAGNPGVNVGRNAPNSAASGGGRAGVGGTAGAAGGAAGNAVACNGYTIGNIPNGTYTGAGTYGTIYGVIG